MVQNNPGNAQVCPGLQAPMYMKCYKQWSTCSCNHLLLLTISNVPGDFRDDSKIYVVLRPSETTIITRDLLISGLKPSLIQVVHPMMAGVMGGYWLIWICKLVSLLSK